MRPARSAGSVRSGRVPTSATVDASGGWPVDAEFTEATRGLKRAELTAALGGPWRYLAGRLTAR
ncbi:hypothetical protein QP157_11925 [Sphingomonas sp. LR61]|uniref:hypothetical protein n=1 Tax=Sphingomonas sp. LR61 TaxID=3050234 RepID=UPI002FE09CA7